MPNQVPPAYREVLYWKLTESRRRLVLINLLALPLGAVAAPVFFWLAARVGRVAGADFADAGNLLGVIVGALLTLSLHELAHGLAMRAFGAQPRYGFKPEAGAFYATAPGYAFTRRQYLIVIFAPLVSLSALAVLGMWALAGSPVVPILALCAVINAMGACGDVYMGGRVAQYPASAYVIDEADGMRLFLPEPAG